MRRITFSDGHQNTDNTHEEGARIRLLLRPQNKVSSSGGHFSTLESHPDTTCHSVVARNNDILKRLVLEAKREYEKDAEHRVHIYMADT